MKRGKPLRRKKRLRPVSPKRQSVQEARRAMVAEQLGIRPLCEAPAEIRAFAGCRTVATELHEPLTRARAPRTDTILDPGNTVSLCRACHNWIHAHPKRSTELGMLKHSWEARNG